jgi:hypothetical protein
LISAHSFLLFHFCYFISAPYISAPSYFCLKQYGADPLMLAGAVMELKVFGQKVVGQADAWDLRSES